MTMASDGGHAAAGPCYDADAEIDEVILRLDLTLVRPDDHLTAPVCSMPNDQRLGDQARTAAASGTGCAVTPGNDTASSSSGDVKSNKPQVSSSRSSSQQADEDKKKSSKPLDFIRRLRPTDNHHQRSAARSDSKRKSPEPLKVRHVKKVKGKVFPYSLPSVGPGADPGVQAVSPQVT